jgi:hypothetical protein
MSKLLNYKINFSSISSPYFVYAIAFSVALLLYLFNFSPLFPRLSWQLITFISGTIVVSTILGITTRKLFSPQKIKIQEDKDSNLWFTSICVVFIYGYAINNTIPIVSIFLGDGMSAARFSIGKIHTFFFSLSIFYTLHLFHQYLSTKKTKLLIFYLVLLILNISVCLRWYILFLIIGSIFVYIQVRSKISVKAFLRLILLGLLLLWFFGKISNERELNGNRDKILAISAADKNFTSEIVPKEYYWTYFYGTYPLATFQNTIDNKSTEADGYNFICLLKYEMVPQWISIQQHLLHDPHCDVSPVRIFNSPVLRYSFTAYACSYVVANWWGPIIFFLFLMLIAFVYMFFMPKKSKYYPVATSVIAMIFITLPVTNFWLDTMVSYLLFIPVVLLLLHRENQHPQSSQIPETSQ